MAQNEQKKLQTVKLNYDTRNGGNWTAYVLAFSAQEAINYTKKVLGNNFYATREIGQAGPVDAISEEVQSFLKQNQQPEKETLLQCPWCDRTFDSKHGLKVHLSKSKCRKSEES